MYIRPINKNSVVLVVAPKPPAISRKLRMNRIEIAAGLHARSGVPNQMERKFPVRNFRKFVGAFHSMKNSGLNFRKFAMTNGTTFS